MRASFEHWLDRRIPASNSITLHHRQTFILPTRFGYMMLFILFLMLLAATNYQNSMAFLLTFTLGSLGFNVMILTHRNLTGLTIRAKRSEPVFAGQVLQMLIIVSTTDIRDHYSIGFGTKNEVQRLLDVPSASSVQTSITVLPEQRGWYSPDRLYAVTVFPFGLLRAWSWFKFNQQYLVYPAPIDPGITEHLSFGKLDQDRGSVTIGNEDFFGIRSYRKGDPKRKIHWRAYAREQGLHTMEFVEPEGKASILDFDNFVGVDVELRLSWLCFLVLKAEATGDRYGLKLPELLIAADHGTKHRQRCLQALALFEAGGQQ